MIDRVSRALRPLLRDLAASALYAAGVTGPRRARARGDLTVVTFHRVLSPEAFADYPLQQIAVTTDEFAWFLDLFRTHYTCGSLRDIHRRWQEGAAADGPYLAITLDDGQLDNFENARPLLDQRGLQATFFVATDAVDGNELLWHDRFAYTARALVRRNPEKAAALFTPAFVPAVADENAVVNAAIQAAKHLPPDAVNRLMHRVECELGMPSRPAWDGVMTWDHLIDLARAGHEVGSHSLSHPILPLVDDAQLERELSESRKRLEQRLGIPCDSFCYPNGSHDARVLAATRGAGYARAVTTLWGANAKGADPMALSRFDIQGKHARDRFGRMSEARQTYRMSRLFAGPR